MTGATVKGPTTRVTFTDIAVVNDTTITATMTVSPLATPGSGLRVTVTNPASAGFGSGYGAILTIT